MTKWLGTICLAAIFLIGVTAPTVRGDDNEGSRATLKGITTVHVLVEDLDNDAQTVGLTKEGIQTDVELKLVLAGMHVVTREEWLKLPGAPRLYVNVSVLPPELIRKGRFDELFFVDLPTQAERRQILGIQLNKRKRNPNDFALDRVATAARGYSGAEIESVVQTALYAAYSQKQQLTDQHLIEAIQSTVPLSTTRAEEINALRQWAGQRAVPASTPEARAERA